MAHFAKLNSSNIVVQVEIVSNSIATTEKAGVDFLNNLYKTNDVWKQTSYNTKDGEHRLGGTPFRKNYAGIDYTYDESRDAFIPPKTYPSMILNETTCNWEYPIPKPTLTQEQIDNNNFYVWDEEQQNWDLIEP